MIITHKGRRRKDGTLGRSLACPGKTLTGCTTPRYDLEVIEGYVLEQIKKLRLDPEYFRETRSNTQTAGELERIEILEDRIKGNDAKISRLMDLYTIGGIDLAAIKDKVETYNLESTTLRGEIERIKDSLSEEIDDEEIRRLAESLEQDAEDPEKARIACKALIEKIEINGRDVTIQWTF